jgi:diaminohydroxyphosphoribosylaminopyrimidine deaminase / 5-amino-6-(5-phosphoribosylamino)uracil reductase
MATEADERFMRLALAEAKKGLGRTSPNPAVGAVLVCGGDVLAKGHHRAAGRAHAEVECVRRAQQPIPADAMLYVTLEPCSTTGRTPPCTDAIMAAGVKHVVVGATDPNPKHQGRGVAQLRAAGVNVTAGVLADECSTINEAWNKWIVTGRPFVIAKCGMSLDGRLTRPAGEPQWITSPASREHANRRRALVDAIVVGARTVRADNPRLTVRSLRSARQPWRIVLTRSGSLPSDAHLFTDAFVDRTLVFKDRPLAEVLDELGAREITSVLIEGGGEILAQALDQQLIDRVDVYVGPVFTGGPVLAFGGRGAGATMESLQLRDVRYERIRDDVFVSGRATPAARKPE